MKKERRIDGRRENNTSFKGKAETVERDGRQRKEEKEVKKKEGKVKGKETYMEGGREGERD